MTFWRSLFPNLQQKSPLKRRERGNSGKKKAVAESNDEAAPENDVIVIDVKSTPKGTTPAHFIKFINELLDIMYEDETLEVRHLTMDSASIRKSKPMIRKIEARGYRVVHSPFTRLS